MIRFDLEISHFGNKGMISYSHIKAEDITSLEKQIKFLMDALHREYLGENILLDMVDKINDGR